MAKTSTKGTDLLDHPYLSTIGLFFESHAGLAVAMERRLETETSLSVQWFEVLIRLARSPGHRLRMSDLAAQTTLSASGLTRAIDRLEGAGLVQRAACPSDRRGSFAVLTEAGEERIMAAVPVHVQHLTELLEEIFSPAELEQFAALARRLRDGVNPEAALASSPDCVD